MGLFDSLKGVATGAALSILKNKLGSSGNSGLINVILNELLSSNGSLGGLLGLAQKFNMSDLGDIFQSWVSNDENKPISKEQMGSVLGDNFLNSLSNQVGVNNNDLLSGLTSYLPNIINSLTANGELPSSNEELVKNIDVSSIITSLLKK